MCSRIAMLIFCAVPAFGIIPAPDPFTALSPEERTRCERVFDVWRRDGKGTDAEVEYVVGICFLNGIKAPKDAKAAADLFRRSADRGYAPAQYALGNCFMKGIGVEKDAPAAVWTGGGEAPIVRVTRWDAAGGLVCDRKLNRPGTVAEIEAAIGACGLAGK